MLGVQGEPQTQVLWRKEKLRRKPRRTPPLRMNNLPEMNNLKKNRQPQQSAGLGACHALSPPPAKMTVITRLATHGTSMVSAMSGAKIMAVCVLLGQIALIVATATQMNVVATIHAKKDLLAVGGVGIARVAAGHLPETQFQIPLQSESINQHLMKLTRVSVPGSAALAFVHGAKHAPISVVSLRFEGDRPFEGDSLPLTCLLGCMPLCV